IPAERISRKVCRQSAWNSGASRRPTRPYMASRQLQKLPAPAGKVSPRPRSPRWKACECAETMPGRRARFLRRRSDVRPRLPMASMRPSSPVAIWMSGSKRWPVQVRSGSRMVGFMRSCRPPNVETPRGASQRRGRTVCSVKALPRRRPTGRLYIGGATVGVVRAERAFSFLKAFFAEPLDRPLQPFARGNEIALRQVLVGLVGHLDGAGAEDGAVHSQALQPAGVGGEGDAGSRALAGQAAEVAVDGCALVEEHGGAVREEL